MADLCCFMVEANTILQSNYPLIKIFKIFNFLKMDSFDYLDI